MTQTRPVAPSRTRRSIALATAFTALATGSAGAHDRLSLLDLLTPEMLLQRAVQMGIVSLRTQMDLQYDQLTADVASGQVALSGLQVWPPDLPWDLSAACKVSAERTSITSAGLIALDRLRLKVELIGVDIAPECIPDEFRPILLAPDRDQMQVSHAYVDVEYTLSSARADVAVHFDSPGLAALDATAAFTYVSIDARGGGNPKPAAFLEQATVEIENRGVWARFRQMLPPQMQDPPTAVAMAVGGMSQALMQGNAAATRDGTTQTGTGLTPKQEEFVESLRTQAERFLVDEDRLVLEITAAEGEVMLTGDLFEDPRRLFAELQPLLRAQPYRRGGILDQELMARALDQPDSLTEVERLRAGRALITGVGAPRVVTRGVALLTPLAEDGNADAARTLAEELAASSPALAYRHGLVAAAARAEGTVGVLDRLEAELGMVRALEIQAETMDQATLAEDRFDSLAAIRTEALARLTGAGAMRNYRAAWYWASLGAAAGDPAAKALRDEIDARMRLHGAETVTAWHAAVEPLAESALQIWMSRDLASRFSAR